MKCPNCNVDLVMTDRNGIEIDYCPKCRGIWLDRGELDKIIERSTQHVADKRPNDYQEGRHYQEGRQYHDSREGDYRKKKKESFLGDLFDF